MISATRVPELLAESLELGSFLVNYGYDVTAWNESHRRIVQDIENKNNSRSLLAVANCPSDSRVPSAMSAFATAAIPIRHNASPALRTAVRGPVRTLGCGCLLYETVADTGRSHR